MIERDDVVLFEASLRRAGSTSSALDQVVSHALGIESGALAIVLPPLGQVEPPGRSVDGMISVQGLTIACVDPPDEVVVPLADEMLVRVPAADLELRGISGIDPDLRLVEVSGSSEPGVVQPFPASVEWARVVAVGQLALAHELVGASRDMLELARDHAVERIQFGQPIARFQAVRHRLADAYVAIESADAAIAAAWDDGSAVAAALAKAVAGRNARVVVRHCQQVLAGIGFTAEHPFHRHLRRVLVLDRLLGDGRSLLAAVGAELLRTRRMPPPVPL